MEITVDNRLRMSLLGLPPEVQLELKAAFVHDNALHYKLKRINKRAGYGEPARIRTWTEGAHLFSVPRGGAPKVREVLTRHGVPYTFKDERQSGSGRLELVHNVKWYPFQADMIGRGVEVQNCIWRSPTGSGKTTAAIGFICEVGLHTMVVVWTGVLMDQWTKRFLKETNVCEVGRIGGGSFKLRPVTVAMQQSLNKLGDSKWEQLQEYFGCVVCDELQMFAAETFLKTVDRLDAKYRLGVSADETRKDEKEFLVYDMFGEVVADVKYDDLVEQGFIHDVEVRVIPTQHRAPFYREQREAFGRYMRERSGKKPRPPDFNRLLDNLMRDDERNELGLDLAAGEILKGHCVLMFSHRREHCLRLDSMATAQGLKAGRLLGSKADVHEFERTLQGIEAGTIDIAAGTYKAIGQGLDLPRADRAIIMTPAAQSKQFWGQVRGRLCRRSEGKTDAVAYYLWDSDVGTKPLKNLRSWNKHVSVWHDGEWVDVRSYLREVA